MADVIGGYRCLTPFHTAGSGSARWCMAERGTERFFLKEFLNPVYPVRTDTPLGKRQMERCLQFEGRKQRLYAAASCVIGDVLVPVVDFFRSDGHYYAVSEALPEGVHTAADVFRLNETERRDVLDQLALCLQRLHTQGVVHGDLKPEHVLLIPQEAGWQVKLIDLDSGFLVEEPPMAERELEGDPAYLAPEMFLRMVGQEAVLGTALDGFAMGALIHQIWTGELPWFDRERYHYLYEAALDGGEIKLKLPEEWKTVVNAMLCAEPEKRAADGEVTALFAPKAMASERPKAVNGLKSLLKT